LESNKVKVQFMVLYYWKILYGKVLIL